MEVNNYVNALNEAIEALKQLPISSRLIKATHQQLLKNVRGEYKMPGEFRTSQNWMEGILIEVNNQNRNRVFVFESYLKIFGED